MRKGMCWFAAWAAFMVGVAVGAFVYDVNFKNDPDPVRIEFVEIPVCVDAAIEVVEEEEVNKEVYRVTAYCPCERCCGVYGKNRPVDEFGETIVYGASGERLKEGVSIAVDPEIIPYGTTVVMFGKEYVAQDCGGAIQGNCIDIYFNDHKDAVEFGVQYAEATIKGG